MEAARELRSHVLTLWSLSTPAGFSSPHICPISNSTGELLGLRSWSGLCAVKRGKTSLPL